MPGTGPRSNHSTFVLQSCFYRTAAFEFRDNGPGVADEDLPHILERFYRAEKSRNRATGGAGFGLTIARGLVTAMGGSIEYAVRQGFVATFVITLPLARGRVWADPRPSR